MRVQCFFRLLPLMPAIIAGGCGYDKFSDMQPSGSESLAANMDIGYLKQFYRGSALNISDDIIVAGYVTANDRSGNFYRSFMLEDATGAVEIKAGLYRLSNYFPVGRYVAVRAKGLSLGGYMEVIQIGTPSHGSGYYQTDYMGRYRDEISGCVVVGDDFKTPEPMRVDYGGLSEKICGRLVSIGPLTLDHEDEAPAPGTSAVTWAEAAAGGGYENTYRYFTTADGKSVAVFINGYADFAGDEAPSAQITVTGILMKGRTDRSSDMYVLKIRDLRDVRIY